MIPPWELARQVREVARPARFPFARRELLRLVASFEYMQAARFLTGNDTPPLGSGLTMPLLLIQGEEDRVTPAAANAELLCRSVPDGMLVMLPGRGHLPEVEAPAQVNELIEQHLCACAKR